MHQWQSAACAAALIFPAIIAAQENGEKKETEEIVVLGRAVVTSATEVQVEREFIIDAATVLKDIPGANVNRNGVVTGIAQYRGMYGDRVAIGIDSLAIVSGGPNAMDTPLSYMSPMITEELVVDRGIASVSSAPESIGGHINTKLARGHFSDGGAGMSGTLGTRYTDNGGISTSAGRLTVANERHRASIVAEFDNGDDISTPAGEIRPSMLTRDRYDVSYAFSNRGTDFLVFAGRLDTTDAGTPALPMDIRFIETDLYGLQFSTAVTDRVRLESRFAYNDVEPLMDNFTLRSAPIPMMFRQNLTHGSGSQFTVSGLFDFNGSSIRVGVDGIMAEHDSVITNPNIAMFRVNNFNNIQRDVAGLFVELNRGFESSSMEMGLRYKQVNTGAGQVGAMGMPAPMQANVDMLADAFNSADRDLDWDSVDFVVKYHRDLSDTTEWLLEFGSKTRAPSYQELYLWLPLQATGGLADGRTYIGDLALDEERSNEVVVGIATAVGRLSLAPQIFYRDIGDYIQGIPATNMLANMVSTMMSGAPALQFANVDAEIWGADIAWKYELNDRWFLDGIATWSRGRRTDVSDNLYRLAPFNGSVGLTYAADSWSVKPEFVYYASQDKVSTFNTEQTTDSYELVNVAFEWTPTESWRIEARIDNLFDETYQDHLTGINRAMGSDIPVGERLYGAERTVSAGVIFSF
jgi:iron complex outermembrane receptor protein